jgi:hypothetical protein
MEIYRIADLVRRPNPLEIKVADLTERMDAGVCTTGATHGDMLAAEPMDRGYQLALHGTTICLDLPADERSAVILDCDLIARHDGWS